MPSTVNVLVMIHGMAPDRNPSAHLPTYKTFWGELIQVQPQLVELIDHQVYVEWGHELPNAGPSVREDQRLTRSQAFAHDQVAYNVVERTPSPNNVILDDIGIPGLRGLVTSLREGVIIFGLGDVVYYCSAEGERQVRSVAYKQVLDRLVFCEDLPDVRLHIFAHSLGVTIAHDSLYGLFAPGITPDFFGQGDPESVERFKKWRVKAAPKADGGTEELRLGSFAAAASQLPLTVMRKQRLVDSLFEGKRLDPSVIGVKGPGIKWKIFYDLDDILAFATRGLYAPNGCIKDVQVNTGATPATAHAGYWTNQTVIRETAELIGENAV